MPSSNPVVETYSRLAAEYDKTENLASCWGRVTQHSLGLVTVNDAYNTVVDVGCGTGRELAQLASLSPPAVQFIGVEPAANMREIAAARTDQLANARVLDGSFENLPLESGSVDYLYSILAFHWTTDLDKSVAELGRVVAPTGDMDLTFIGRHNGREFIQKTTPVFFKYMSPSAMVKAASLRKQLTLEETTALFRETFDSPALSVEETYHTYYDTLEGHWSWWVRVEGQLLDIPPEKKKECDQATRAAISTLATDKGIPYTVHLMHVRLRQS
jgi:ubiquinone/menaquinone biosynthesis C-methylase UbiE